MNYDSWLMSFSPAFFQWAFGNMQSKMIPWRRSSSTSHTSVLRISFKTSFISFTVSPGFLFPMISRTASNLIFWAEGAAVHGLVEVAIFCSVLSGILIFRPKSFQLLFWSNFRQMFPKVVELSACNSVVPVKIKKNKFCVLNFFLTFSYGSWLSSRITVHLYV